MIIMTNSIKINVGDEKVTKHATLVAGNEYSDLKPAIEKRLISTGFAKQAQAQEPAASDQKDVG